MTMRLSIDGFVRKLEAMPEEVRSAAVRGLQGAAMVLAAEVPIQISHASPYPAVDTSYLRNSVQLTVLHDGAEVSVDAPYAAPMEYGTRPFTPPLKPLVEWAMRKGFAEDEKGATAIARAVQKKIAREGIAPRAYFRKSWNKSRRKMHAEVRRELRAIGYGKVRVLSTIAAVDTGGSE